MKIIDGIFSEETFLHDSSRLDYGYKVKRMLTTLTTSQKPPGAFYILHSGLYDIMDVQEGKGETRDSRTDGRNELLRSAQTQPGASYRVSPVAR